MGDIGRQINASGIMAKSKQATVPRFTIQLNITHPLVFRNAASSSTVISKLGVTEYIMASTCSTPAWSNLET